MYSLIVFLPLCASIASGLFGRFLGHRGAALITTGSVLVSCLLSIAVFYEVALAKSPCYLTLAPWIVSFMLDATWGFLFDSLTGIMLIVVTFISSLVHLYSISYMEHDPHSTRFMCYLSFFTFCMLMLITSDNLLHLFFGWEGVGLASYLLISFWFTRLQANKAAIKAMLVNRVGDFALTLGILGCLAVFQSVDLSVILACVPSCIDWNESVLTHDTQTAQKMIVCMQQVDAITAICILLFIGAVGKSAQIGLHTWLPDAMEAPTPVSALLHAATMVTAGVFLIARCSPLFEYAPLALSVITFVGAMTAFFAATTGLMQNDLKRVIAYSTCSQLGYMVFACGLSQYSVSLFHLMNHAFFKALLFLSAGAVIHAMSDEQDMRQMGGLASLLPFTYAMMFVGSLSLMGLPFLTGFYSKDVILELAYAHYSISGQFAFWLGSISVVFTSYYSLRVLFLTFLGPCHALKPSFHSCHDVGLLMAITFILLAFGSICVGYCTRDMMIGLGTPFWGNSLVTLPQHELFLESEFGVPVVLKWLPLASSSIGAVLAYTLHSGVFHTGVFWSSSLTHTVSSMLVKRWLFDKVYNAFVIYPSLRFGYSVSLKTLDKGWFDHLGPVGVSATLRLLAKQVSLLQSGFVYHYALVMLLGLTVFLAGVGFDTRLYCLLVASLSFPQQDN